jgi:hypothetical protein
MTKRNVITSDIISLVAANLQILWNRDKNITFETSMVEHRRQNNLDFFLISIVATQFNNGYTTRMP